jgi:uncharacterized membrane protein (UPF0127 family)
LHYPSLRIVVSAALIIAVACYAAYTLASTPGTVYLAEPPTEFSVNGHRFGITSIAATQDARQSGLMNTKITNSTFMLFVFPTQGEYPFWMSQVNSSLDIIWLNVTGTTGKVVSLASDVPGCNSITFCPDYSPSSPANWVLEAKGGFAQAYGVRVGTLIAFN